MCFRCFLFLMVLNLPILSTPGAFASNELASRETVLDEGEIPCKISYDFQGYEVELFVAKGAFCEDEGEILFSSLTLDFSLKGHKFIQSQSISDPCWIAEVAKTETEYSPETCYLSGSKSKPGAFSLRFQDISFGKYLINIRQEIRTPANKDQFTLGEVFQYPVTNLFLDLQRMLDVTTSST